METSLKKPPLKVFTHAIRMFTQKIGASLSGMIMPIIGVIIAWGLATAFFIPNGWTPVAIISDNIVGPIIKYLIPILIGFLGGRQVYGDRGGFMGALATAGVVGGAEIFEAGFWPIKESLGPQFLGAMISGPLFAYIFKKIEMLWEGKIKTGFEMLINNFSFGIFGLGAAIFSLFITPFAVFGLTWVLGAIVNPLAKYHALPVTSLFVEPAKPLFLNNAINHGVFTPLGTIEQQTNGKSILFYIESNPGPGLGVLIAYILMDKKQRGSAGSASIIHFFGGIHEVYFPFIIMRPILIIAAILGGATGVAILQIFNAGAVAPASPGSVIALFAESAHGAKNYIGLAISIVSATGVSLLVAIILIKLTNKRVISKNEAIAKMNAAKGKDSKYIKSDGLENVKSIIFACDAGMGSSTMGAGLLRKLFKEKNIDIKVTNSAIKDLSNLNPDLIIVQEMLADRAKSENNTQQFVVKNFLDEEQYQNLISQLKESQKNKTSTKSKKVVAEVAKLKIANMINKENIEFNGKSKTIDEAINNAGEILVKNNFVTKEYIKSMHARNKDVSVYIGNHVAIPHGQSGSSQWIKKSGISITTYPNGLDWNNEKVYLVIGIAGKGDKHIDILSDLATKLRNGNIVKEIAQIKTIKELKEILK